MKEPSTGVLTGSVVIHSLIRSKAATFCRTKGQFRLTPDKAVEDALKRTALNKTEPVQLRNLHRRRNTSDACGSKS